jgi:hypothetical protein
MQTELQLTAVNMISYAALIFYNNHNPSGMPVAATFEIDILSLPLSQ